MTEFSSLKIVGGLLPADLLGRIFAGDPQVPGTSPQTYGLERGESVRAPGLPVLALPAGSLAGLQAAGSRGRRGHLARVTRERWLRILLRELGFHQLTAGSFELEGKSFPVSHQAGHVPVHLLGWGTDLDHKTPHVTARAPQSMLQELLNRDDDYLWAIAVQRRHAAAAARLGRADRLRLRRVRPGSRSSTASCSPTSCCSTSSATSPGSRSRATAAPHPATWSNGGASPRTRASGPSTSCATASSRPSPSSAPGSCPTRTTRSCASASAAASSGSTTSTGRCCGWSTGCCSGSSPKTAAPCCSRTPRTPTNRPDAALREARQRYDDYFSSARLRQLARRRRGDRHGDLFEAVQLVFDALGTEGGVPELALPGIGGIFEIHAGRRTRAPAGRAARRRAAVQRGPARRGPRAVPGQVPRRRRLAAGRLRQPRRRGTRQRLRVPAGTHPALRRRAALLHAGDAARQRTQGDRLLLHARPRWSSACSTPPSTRCSTRPARTERQKNGSRRCSASPSATPPAAPGTSSSPPPAGSPSGSPPRKPANPSRPTPVVRAALRRVVGRCIYGVDINPMAAELAKVSLWLEALEPGKPLSYLDQNIRVGNSLLGVTPALLAEGLPDAAFTPIEGDDRKVCSALKKQNAAERDYGQHDLFSPGRASRSPTPSWPSAPTRSPTPCPTASKTCTSTSSARPSNSPRHPNAASRSSSPTPGAPPSSSPRPRTPAPPRSPTRSSSSSARTTAPWT